MFNSYPFSFTLFTHQLPVWCQVLLCYCYYWKAALAEKGKRDVPSTEQLNCLYTSRCQIHRLKKGRKPDFFFFVVILCTKDLGLLLVDSIRQTTRTFGFA